MIKSKEAYIDGLVQEWRKCSASAMELHLSCINSSIYCNNHSAQNFFQKQFMNMLMCNIAISYIVKTVYDEIRHAVYRYT